MSKSRLSNKNNINKIIIEFIFAPFSQIISILMAMCIYSGCTSVQQPFSSVTFFSLPTDWRRDLWIENSGNKELRTLPNTARRVVCEKHFSPSSLRKQFHRTILCRGAIPEKWRPQSNNSNTSPEDTVTGNEVECDDVHQESSKDGWEEEWPNDSLEGDECHVIEIMNHSDNSLQSVTGNVDDTETEIIEYLEVENKQTVEEEAPKRFKIVDSSNKSTQSDILILACDNIVQQTESTSNTELLNAEKRRRPASPNPADKSIGVAKKSCNQNSEIAAQLEINNPIGESTDCEAVVSSASSQADQTRNSSIPNEETSSEDRYFVLSLVGILQRIPPQKRAFAKLNIMKYLTELEYGQEASLK